MTSRRDDLLSLSYFLIYLLNMGSLPGIDMHSKLDRNESFKKARKAKIGYNLTSLCKGRSKSLDKFVTECF